MKGMKIRGTGRCLPERVVSNADLEQIVDTNNEWIVSRTGISRRHHCTQETHTQLCVQAARQAMEKAGVTPDQIGVCIVATLTADMAVPSAACLMQRELGLPTDAVCFDLNAACTGFIYALHTAQCLLNAQEGRYGLVVGAEVLSRVTNWEDRSTCILFGDGAGAAVVECREEWPSIGTVLGAQGDGEILSLPGLNAPAPSLLSMEGTKVFKFAVEIIPQCIEQVLEGLQMTMADVDFFVFHQANGRIIDLVAKKLRIPQEKYYKNIQEYGNTSAASIPLVLSELQDKGLVVSGSRVLMVGFGGGLTWGGALVEFA